MIFPFSYLSGGTAIDAQAQAHYNRVIADGGVIPKGLAGCSAYFTAVKAIYATSDITTAIAAAYEDRKSTRLNSSHSQQSRMPSSA